MCMCVDYMYSLLSVSPSFFSCFARWEFTEGFTLIILSYKFKFILPKWVILFVEFVGLELNTKACIYKVLPHLLESFAFALWLLQVIMTSYFLLRPILLNRPSIFMFDLLNFIYTNRLSWIHFRRIGRPYQCIPTGMICSKLLMIIRLG